MLLKIALLKISDFYFGMSIDSGNVERRRTHVSESIVVARAATRAAEGKYILLQLRDRVGLHIEIFVKRPSAIFKTAKHSAQANIMAVESLRLVFGSLLLFKGACEAFNSAYYLGNVALGIKLKILFSALLIGFSEKYTHLALE